MQKGSFLKVRNVWGQKAGPGSLPPPSFPTCMPRKPPKLPLLLVSILDESHPDIRMEKVGWEVPRPVDSCRLPRSIAIFKTQIASSQIQLKRHLERSCNNHRIIFSTEVTG